MANQGNLQNQQNLNDAYAAGRETLQSISSELGKQRSITSQAAAEYTKMDSILKKLQDRQGDISNLSAKEIENLKKKYQLSLDENKALADKLAKDKNLNKLTEQQIQFKLKSNNLSKQEKELLRAKLDGFKIEQDILNQINEDLNSRVEYEEKIKDLTGATGAVLDGMKGSMNALGMSSMSNYLKIDAAKQAMEEEADAIARGEKEGGKFEVRMAGIKALAQGLSKTLFSAEAVIGFIVKELAKGSQNMADFQKQTGIGGVSAYAMNVEMKGIALASNDTFITSEKLNKSFAMMTDHLGVSADILGGEALVSATNLTERLGMSAENAGQLTTFTRLQGKNTEEILSNSVATVGAFNKQNKTAINAKQVMNDVAGATKATYLNMGKNVTAMTAAASKARALGLSLAQVEKISESLLNFEDSIGKEMEANLLLGGGVNLAKAREYALTGDVAKLTDEIGKQESIRNAFATKNVIAQQAAADALGISKEELAGMALQNDLNALSAKEFKDRYGEATYEAMKSRSATEKLSDAMAKITDILGSIVQLFSPLLDLLVWLTTNSFSSVVLAGVVGFIALAKAIKVAGIAYSGLTGLFGKGKLAAAATGIKDKLLGGAGEAASKVPGGKQGGGMSSLTDSIQKIKPAQLLAGGAALLMISGAVYIFAKAAQEFAKVSWEDMAKAGVGLLGLVAALAAVGAIMMSGVGAVAILAGAAAIVIMAAGLFILGKALQEISKALPGMAAIFPMVAGLAQALGPLLLLGPALFGIAAGLGAISLAGLVALPAIGGLVLLSKAAPALISLGIGGGEKTAGAAKGKGEESQLEKKIGELITVLNREQTININIDGGKVATATIKHGPLVKSGQS